MTNVFNLLLLPIISHPLFVFPIFNSIEEEVYLLTILCKDSLCCVELDNIYFTSWGEPDIQISTYKDKSIYTKHSGQTNGRNFHRDDGFASFKTKWKRKWKSFALCGIEQLISTAIYFTAWYVRTFLWRQKLSLIMHD